MTEKPPTQIQKSSVLFDIDEYSDLEEGWDGYSAPPIGEDISEEVKRIAVEEDLPDTDFEIFPTGRGTIQFEFYGSEREGEFEIVSPSEGIVIIDDTVGEPYRFEKTHRGTIEECISILNNFL